MTYTSMASNNSFNLVESADQQDIIQYNVTRPFVLPVWQQVIWSLFFGIMVTVAVIGNTIIMWIIVAHRRMRTVTNYFLLNLSIADFMMATFNVIFNLVFMLESHWPFGLSYCIFNSFVANVTVSASVFTMMVMSIDRYMAIVRPLTPRMSRRTVCLIIASIWCLSTLLALPSLLYSTVLSFKYNFDENRTLCLLEWPDGIPGVSKKEYWYNVVFLLVTYVIPMILMAITYSRMGAVLWGNTRIGETTDRQEALIKSKQKVVKMLATVIMLFGICWLPYHVYFLYVFHDSGIQHFKYIQHIYLGIYWLAMSNCMYNPIVYYWMNVRFRAYFEVVLCWCWNKRNHSRHSRSLNLHESRTLSTRTRSFRLTLSKTLGIKRSFKDRHMTNNIDCHHC